MSDLTTLAAAVDDAERVVTLADCMKPVPHPEISGYRLAPIRALKAAARARVGTGKGHRTCLAMTHKRPLVRFVPAR